MSTVQAPVAGTVRALSSVSDPVFAAEMVGSGAAVEPRLEKQQVTAGQPVVGWDPQVAVDHGMDTVVLVCQMETEPGAITPEGADSEVEQGGTLFTTV